MSHSCLAVLTLASFMRVELRLCREDAETGSATHNLCEPACLYVQILLEGARCKPAGAASCLSAEHTWQRLVPDFAALVRSLCAAVEAWPPEVPKPPGMETQPGDLHVPLGLQYTVRPSQSAAPRGRVASLQAGNLCLRARSAYQLVNRARQTPARDVQHVLICGTLYEGIDSRAASEAELSMFIEAMCCEATSELLCRSMEKGLGTGDAQAERVHMARWQLLPCVP